MGYSRVEGELVSQDHVRGDPVGGKDGPITGRVCGLLPGLKVSS